MDMPKPRTPNEIAYSQAFSRAQIPAGAHQHYAKIRLPHPKPERRPAAAVISLVSGCKGDPAEVLALAQRLVRELVAEGRKEEAQAILKAVKEHFAKG